MNKVRRFKIFYLLENEIVNKSETLQNFKKSETLRKNKKICKKCVILNIGSIHYILHIETTGAT